MNTRYTWDLEDIEIDEPVTEGGSGSGNFGHAGRPGEVGGSAPSGQFVNNDDPAEGPFPLEIPSSAKDFGTIGDDLMTVPYSQSSETKAMEFGLNQINNADTNTLLKDNEEVYNAVYDYMNEGYKVVNEYYHKNKLPHGFTQNFVDNMVDAIDEACENEIQSDIVVYRSMKVKDLDIGDEFIDQGYVSTSLDRSIASSFQHGMLARIYVPKGSYGLFLGNVPSGGRQEWEVLLARQTKFRVLNREGNRIELEVVNE